MEVYSNRVQISRLVVECYQVYATRKPSRHTEHIPTYRRKRKIYYSWTENSNDFVSVYENDIPYTGTATQFFSMCNRHPHSAIPDDVEKQILAAEHLSLFEKLDDTNNDDVLIWYI